MLDVILYAFAKEADSTAIPKPENGVTYACELKDVCSILSPSLVFHMVDGWTPAQINYIHIPIWSRYYFASWTWQDGLWIADCAVDVLASWRTDIGNSQQYVLRSSAESNGYITDSLYPTTNGMQFAEVTANNPWVSNLESGFYVVGVLNGDDAARGGVSYYVMNQSDINRLRNLLFINTDYLQIPDTEISSELAKALFNPFQYIVSCKWYPFEPPHGAGKKSAINVGWWKMAATGWELAADPVYSTSYEISLPTHPQAAERGDFLNGEPYTRYTFNYGPWGDVALNASQFVNQPTKKLTVNLYVDTISGDGVLQMTGSGDIEILRTAANIGIDIQLSQVTMGVFDSIASGVSGLLSMPSAAEYNAAGGGIMGAIKTGLSGWSNYGKIGNGVAQSFISRYVPTSTPTVQTLPPNGSIAAFILPPILRAQFSKVVDEDNARSGRPLCAVKQISIIPGFIMCQNPELPIIATQEEHDAIISYMTGGFYYE